MEEEKTITIASESYADYLRRDEKQRQSPFYAVNWDNPHIQSAVNKMARNLKPGEIVKMTQDEIKAITDPTQFITLPVT